jgi:predicted XRE-type DNA-binding protein
MKLKQHVVTLEDGTTEIIEESSGNIFADLGFPRPDEHLAKANMVLEIEKAIKARRLSQRAAAELAGMDQPTLSKLLRGHFRSISMDRLFEILNRLGRHVEIRVKPARGHQVAATRMVRSA